MPWAWINAAGVLCSLVGTVLLFRFGSPFGQRSRGLTHLVLEQEDEVAKDWDKFQDKMSWVALGVLALGGGLLVWVGFGTLSA